MCFVLTFYWPDVIKHPAQLKGVAIEVKLHISGVREELDIGEPATTVSR